MHSLVEALGVYSPARLLLAHPPQPTPLSDLSPWLFPLGTTPQSAPPSPSPQAIVLFLVTDSQQVRRYCSSLQFYEQHDHQWLPFCLVLISRQPAFLEHLQILNQLQLVLQSDSSILIIKNHQTLLQDLLDKHPGQAARAERIYNKETLPPPSGPVHQIKQMDWLGFYLNFISKQLPLSLSNQSTQVIGLLEPNYRQTTLLTYHQTPSCPLMALPDFSLFDDLSVDNVLRCVMALLCEKQVVVLGHDDNRVVLCLEALLSFIQPLQWTCVYIPNLPIQKSSSMWHVLNTMVPFLVGCHSRHLPFIEQSVERLTTKIIIDTQHDLIYNLEKNIRVPEKLLERSCKTLERLVHKYHKNRGYKEKLEIKEFFINFMMTVLDHYLLHYKKHRPRGSHTTNDIFDHESYLRISPQQGLLSQMNQNMMFSLFIEETAQELDSVPTSNPFLGQFISMTRKLHEINRNNGDVFNLLFDSVLLNTWHQAYFRDLNKELLSNHDSPFLLHMHSLFNKLFFKNHDMPSHSMLSQLNDDILSLDLMRLFSSGPNIAHSVSMVSQNSSRLRLHGNNAPLPKKGISITVPTPENTHKPSPDTPKTTLQRTNQTSKPAKPKKGISTVSRNPLMGIVKEERNLLDKLTQNRFVKEGWEVEDHEPSIWVQAVDYLREGRQWRPSILSRQHSPILSHQHSPQ